MSSVLDEFKTKLQCHFTFWINFGFKPKFRLLQFNI